MPDIKNLGLQDALQTSVRRLHTGIEDVLKAKSRAS